MRGQTKCGIFTYDAVLFSLKKKKGHFNTSYNMDGPLRNYAEISQLKKDK